MILPNRTMGKSNVVKACFFGIQNAVVTNGHFEVASILLDSLL